MGNTKNKNGKITAQVLNRSQKLSIFAGCGFTIWFSVGTTQPIFNVFLTNHLGASSTQLGLLVGLIQLSAVFHLLAIFIYGNLKERKKYYITMHFIHRSFALILAGITFYVGRSGNSSIAVKIIILMVAISWSFANASSSGWWSWIADLIPDKVRGSFFGKRSSIMQIVNIIWFMTVSITLDTLTNINIFYIYSIVFLIAAVAGIADVILFMFVPEPVQENKTKINLKDFLEPLRNRNFVLNSFSLGLGVFAINVFAPFAAPYITSADTIGAPNTWLGIMFVISQMIWILVVPFWGVVMDRFGRKPVVMMGCLISLSYLGYLILNGENYVFVLPVIALIGGLFTPAFWEGINQLMLTLTPVKNRTAFVSWNFTIIGIVSSGGAYLGGLLKDKTEGVTMNLTDSISLNNTHFIILLSVALLFLTMLILSMVKEPKGKELGFVVTRIARPGIFRTFASIGVLSSTRNSVSVAKALRSIDDSSQDLAFDEIIERLYDPDPDVREEAAGALGRIGSHKAVDVLIEQLQDKESTIRSQAAKALGNIGSNDALPALLDGINDPSEDVQNACTRALGSIGGEESVKRLLSIIKNIGSDRLAASGAEAVSRLGAIEAAWEIVPRMHRSLNPVLTRQLAISLANLIGDPGQFYKYVTGKSVQRENNIKILFIDAARKFPHLYKSIKDEPIPGDLKNKISKKIKSLKKYFDEEEFLSSFALLNECVSLITCTLIDTDNNDKNFFRKLYLLDRKTALWWWFIQESSFRVKEASDEVVKIDIMIGLYFLARKTQQ